MAWTDYSSSPPHGTRICPAAEITAVHPLTVTTERGDFPLILLRDGDRIRELGHEYGATTGRPRRCGWFDATILRMAARVNGLTSLALTRLDVLDTVETLKVCTAYRCGDEVLEEFPADPQILERCEPVYEELEGWCAPTTEARRVADLPAKAQAYVDRITDLSRTPISLISVGPARESTIESGS